MSEEPSYLPPNPMWLRLDVDPDNLDPDYRPEITKSENWPGEPVAVLTLGRDDDGHSISTFSAVGELSTYMLLITLLEVTEWHAVNSAKMPANSFLPSALNGARTWLEGEYVRAMGEYQRDEDDD